MKKFISLLLCMAVMISMVSMITVSADQLPTFAKDYYVVNVLESATSTLTNTTADGHVELSDGWMGPSDKGDTIDLGNGEQLDKHYYSHTAGLTATYTFTNVPAGSYEIEYHVSHGNSYYYFPLDITCNGETVSTTLGNTSSTSNLSQAWHSVTTITKNDDSSEVIVKLTTPDVKYASNQNVRTAAVRLKSMSQRTEYVIRNTATSKTADSNGTFELSGAWKDSSNNYNIDGVAGKQIYSTSAGSYAKYNFINSETPISIFNDDNYTGIEEGWYDVYFYYPQWTTNDDPAMGIEVYHNGTISTYTSNLTTFKAGSWNVISDVTAPLRFTGDGSEYVALSNGTAGKYTRIGAIKLVKKVVISNEEPDVEIKDLVSAPAYNEGALTIVTNGSSVETGTKTVYAVVAAYSDGENLLAGVKTTPVTITAGADDAVVPVVLPTQSGTSYKLFILDSLTNAMPIINSFEF